MQPVEMTDTQTKLLTILIVPFVLVKETAASSFV